MYKKSNIILSSILIALILLLFISCSEKKSTNPTPQVPVLTTTAASSVTQTTAQSGGTITSDAGLTVTERGVCWSVNPTPTIADSKTTDGAGIGNFTSSIIGLTAGSPYYVRAYATNSDGTGYGSAVWFTTMPSTIPVLTTANVSEITQTTAQCGGTIISDGAATVTARGVCWSTDSMPTIAGSKTSDSIGVGGFASSITGLAGITHYYVRAYATNNAGTGYGSAISFTTTDSMGTVTDIDGNTYQTVKIGNQWWMAENLKVTHYRIGDDIPNITDYSTWSGLSTGAYCNYNNDTALVATYGRLYNWYAVDTSLNIAPTGWHVPTDSEWQTLVDYLGGKAVAGGKMKEAGITHWIGPNAGATNESGFSALPSGDRSSDGSYDDENYTSMGHDASFWSSTKSKNDYAWFRGLNFYLSEISRPNFGINNGFSVRCVKD